MVHIGLAMVMKNEGLASVPRVILLSRLDESVIEIEVNFTGLTIHSSAD